MTNSYNQVSSGRWDALGSWSDAVIEEHEKAARWVLNLRLTTIIEFLRIMAEDPNAFTTYQRRALMIHVADVLGTVGRDA